MKQRLSLVSAVALAASVFAPSMAPVAAATPLAVPARAVEPVVIAGAQVPDWSRLSAQGAGKGHTYGTQEGQRDAHAGQLVVPPDVRSGVPVDQVVAYAWENGEFTEVPVQVDQRFPYFLANGNSDFGMYSGTDEELTYAWDEESWKKTAGECEAAYPAGAAAMADPVPTLDDDDEIVFMADDAGARAPLDALGPAGSGSERQEIQLVDPRDPASERYVYLFLESDGPSFDETNGYVDYQRDADADQWIDRDTFAEHDPEKLGSSNTGYGANLDGTVCTDDPETEPVETLRRVGDRFPRDGITVSTDTYRFRATGRWMVRGMQITKPGTKREYGPDLIDRWKGRAFQQSPDSSISLVGFEDEQVNWEGNSTLLGELEGPVRAIREVWGADSGTNVTKTETFYRDAITYRYRVRVHPIPPDGLYTSWDYNHDVASTYYNETKTEGVAIDGRNDDIGQVDEAPTGDPAFFDAPDPTFTKPLAFLNWEQVSGKADSGSLVYMFEMKNAQSLENPAVTPYYRDDACLDDGTGDDPSPRAMPGESYEWMQDQANRTDNDPDVREASREYLARPCYTEAPEGYDGPYLQGCFGCHGIHYFATHDSDNAFGVKPTTEIDGQQWQWAVPTEAPANVGDAYANTVKTPLVATVGRQASQPRQDPEDPGPAATRIEITGATSGQTTDEVTLAARLSDEQGPVAGHDLTFTLDGKDVGTAVTDADGVASVQTTLDGPARTVELTASYSGSEERAPSSVTAPFEILPEDSSLALSLERSGSDYVATATLSETDTGAGLAGRTVRFTLNGTEIGTATTDTEGRASIAIKRNQAKKNDSVEAIFDGDDSYSGSRAEQAVPQN